MDDAPREFIEYLRLDPWDAIDLDEPLPDGLGLAALQELRSAVYALLHALDFTLDEAAPIIGRLVEIDSRIGLIERLRPFNCQTLPSIWAKRSGPSGGGIGTGFQPVCPRLLGIAAINILRHFGLSTGQNEPSKAGAWGRGE
jgi:hypothetical protein